MAVRQRRRDPAARGPLQEALLDQERLQHVLDGVALLADRRREVVDADRSAGELLEHRAQELAVHHVEARHVDVEHHERVVGDLARDLAFGAHLGEVAHAAQQPVRDPRRPARAARDLERAARVDRDVRAARPNA